MKNDDRVLQDAFFAVVNRLLFRLDGYLKGIIPEDGALLPRRLNAKKQKQARDAILKLTELLHELIVTAELESVPLGEAKCDKSFQTTLQSMCKLTNTGLG